MRIEAEVKLGYKDVMFRPKRSTLKSRSEVSLEREFTFLHTGKTWSGVPIMAANMDTTGTFEMAHALSEESLFTPLHKHYSVDEWSGFLADMPDSFYERIALSTGTSDKDFEKIQAIVATNPGIQFICIDVANGYSEHFVDFVKKNQKSF
jgi:GMP reductase